MVLEYLAHVYTDAPWVTYLELIFPHVGCPTEPCVFYLFSPPQFFCFNLQEQAQFLIDISQLLPFPMQYSTTQLSSTSLQLSLNDDRCDIYTYIRANIVDL